MMFEVLIMRKPWAWLAKHGGRSNQKATSKTAGDERKDQLGGDFRTDLLR